MAIPHGFWPSHWSAADAAAASGDFAELRAGHGGLFWIQYHPTDGRCTLWFWRDQQAARCLTPAGISVRSRVYEYGGGAFCLTDAGIAFVQESTQQIYGQSLDDGATHALTNRADCRYGDLRYAPAWQAVLAVEECREGEAVVHRLVAISLRGGQRKVLVEGRDFYAAPCLSHDGRRFAWIEWDRPHQPWSETRLCMATVDAQDRLVQARVVAGGTGGESLQQPVFASDGQLYCLSDRAGWWQPWREQGGCLVALDTAPLAEADHAPAPWQLGTVSHWPLTTGGVLLARLQHGWGLLIERDATGRERRLADGFSRFRQLAADAQYYYCIAGAPEHLPAVLAIARHSGQVQLVAGGEQPLPAGEVSLPEAITFGTDDGEAVHAFFYAPFNTTPFQRKNQYPPTVVFLHGGPTSASYPVFDPRIQFWTQRGFAVLDLNYRGSSGYGRAYRQRLKGAWGEVELADIRAAIAHLAKAGRIDAQAVFVRGSSAGGYSALCALAFGTGFRGGASLYGVSDPLALRRVTHKFEGDYLDWLIGDPEHELARYRARTPLYHAGRITAPVIFFQGGLDAVVVPAQTESMVTALRDNGVPVEYHLFPHERHGFRQAENLAQALECEWRFYCERLV